MGKVRSEILINSHRLLSNTCRSSPVPIIIDNNFTIIAFTNGNCIFVINLDGNEVMQAISVTEPYNMIIPKIKGEVNV